MYTKHVTRPRTNPFVKNNLFRTPTFEELGEILKGCANPSEATMVAVMTWNMAHDLYAEECSSRRYIKVPYKAGRRNRKTAGMMAAGL